MFDPSNLPVYATIVVLAAVGLIALVVFSNRRQKKKLPLTAPTPTPTVEAKTISSPEAPVKRRRQPTNPELSSTRANPVYRQKIMDARAKAAIAEAQANFQERHGNALSSDSEPLEQSTQTDLPWRCAGLTDIGQERSLNEDSWGIADPISLDDQPCGLFILADGMGGHQGGDVASQLVVQTITQQFVEQPPADRTQETVESWLKQATKTANEAIITQQEGQTEAEKMGSTLVMALLVGHEAYIANVGDSRAYLLNNHLTRLTKDHSLVARLVELGQITEADARTHPQRNVIYSTMGDPDKMHVDVYHHSLQPEDRLLLCSDGLSGMVMDDQLLKISQAQADPEAVCQAMVDAANQAGGNDNITVILIQKLEASS